METILLLSMLVNTHGYESVSGRATIYYPGDGHCGKTRADGRPFKKADTHIAHRRLPLGTKGYACNVRTGLCARTYVGDRGPFGATWACSKGDPGEVGGIGTPRRVGKGRSCAWWQAQIRLKPGWKRRGAFDLTMPVAKAIGHKAFDKLVFFYAPIRTDRPEV